MATGDKRRSEELLVETERLQSRVLELEQRERSQLATGDDSARRENLYRTVFENTGTATIVIEEDTTISLCNSEFERLSG